jgi:hypothetical protein
MLRTFSWFPGVGRPAQRNPWAPFSLERVTYTDLTFATFPFLGNYTSASAKLGFWLPVKRTTAHHGLCQILTTDVIWSGLMSEVPDYTD